jgi:xanthine dehydrogenase accessory factor
MEYILLEKLTAEIKSNRKAALVTLVDEQGSSPGKHGFMMAVFEDGTTMGTVGGGNFENTARKYALECMDEGKSRLLELELTESSELHMQCGGKASIFIKVFKEKDKLIIAGGGHIALELYKLGKLLNFHVVIIEDREEYANDERFPGCDICIGNIGECMRDYPLDKSCYVVIVTRGHLGDTEALKASIGREAAYVGMIGSRKKTKYVLDQLLDEGCNRSELQAAYAPVGLDLGGDSASEIAFCILSEILLVKNKGQLKHMRD